MERSFFLFVAQVVLILQESSQVNYCSVAAYIYIYHMIFPKVYISLFAVWWSKQILGELTGDWPFATWVKWLKKSIWQCLFGWWNFIFFFGISGPTPWGNGIHVGFEHIVQMGLVQPTTNKLCFNSKFAVFSLTLSDPLKWIRGPKTHSFVGTIGL